jgi:serine/threonine protein kinase
MELFDENLPDHVFECYSEQRPVCDRGISNRELWSVVQQVASGVKYLHDQGIFHSHIKPENSTFPSRFFLIL